MGFSIYLHISVTETINKEAQTQQVASRLILSREAKGSLVLDSRFDFPPGYSWWELVRAGVRYVW